MSTDSIVNTLNLDTSVSSVTVEFGIHPNSHTVIEVNIPATDTPAGTLTLERKDLNGWNAHATGDESFTNPASGAAYSFLNLEDLAPGAYRVAYAWTSGGNATSSKVVIRHGK